MNFCIELPDEVVKEIATAARDRGMTKAPWARQAIFAYLRTAARNKPKYSPAEPTHYPSGYPLGAKCFHCKTACHDPAEVHGYLPEEIGSAELEYAANHKCAS